jgi:hypothetical protein
MTRRARVALLAALILLSLRSDAHAAAVIGGAMNPRGERSHNVQVGWPEVAYVWEGLLKDRRSLGLRVGVQIWPIAASIGAWARFSLVERGRASLSALFAPSFNFAGYGGTRASYEEAYNFGRSRSFRASLGPGINAGLLATVDLRPQLHLLLSFENPVALWIWTAPAGWWLEWPLSFGGGIEYDISWATSIYGRVGAGPALAFAGPAALFGFHWHAFVGLQWRY